MIIQGIYELSIRTDDDRHQKWLAQQYWKQYDIVALNLGLYFFSIRFNWSILMYSLMLSPQYSIIVTTAIHQQRYASSRPKFNFLALKKYLGLTCYGFWLLAPPQGMTQGQL